MKKRILCFGDSNTWGHHAPLGDRFDETTRWTGRLQALLGQDYTVIEEGQCGRTTVWDDPIENRMAGLSYLWPCLESQSPLDLVVIMLGTNDLKPYFGVHAKSIAQSAGRLVDMVQKSPFGTGGQPPKVLLVSPIHAKASSFYFQLFDETAAEKSLQFAQYFRETAESFGCDFLDAAQVAEPDPADGIHLDAQGHDALAHALKDKILTML